METRFPPFTLFTVPFTSLPPVRGLYHFTEYLLFEPYRFIYVSTTLGK